MNGAQLKLEAFVSGGHNVAYNWKQTVTRSDAGANGEPANKPFNDAAADTHLYYDSEQQSTAMKGAAANGGATVFYDDPSDYGGVSWKFHAELSLIGIDENGTQSVLWTTTWGFEVNGAAGVATFENNGQIPGVTQ